ncbi:MAG: hypothetical protein IJ597_02740, partial [Synergistaceae bacterium]|nr:hypothetical protein [Synergistaceae bacterium]
MKNFLAFLIIISALFFANIVNASEYQLETFENKNFTEYLQNSYNEIGTLKIIKDGNENFDTSQKVIVTVQYDGKLTASNDKEQTLAYELVWGDSEPYKNLNSGDKFEFSPSSIDSGIGVKIGVVFSDSYDNVSDDTYKSDIKITAILQQTVGESYNFGNYDWKVLSVDETGNYALLLTEECVETMKFCATPDENDYYTLWSKSDARKYLQNTFLATFTQEQQNQILNVKIQDGYDEKNSTEIIDPSGEDKIFLLSRQDIREIFPSANLRIANLEGTTTAIAWWLRTPESGNNTYGHQTNLYAIRTDGFMSGYDAHNNTYGIRPAIWLNLKSQEKSSTTEISFTKSTASGAPVPRENLKDLTEEELREKISDSSSRVNLSGDITGADSQDVSNLIAKIENIVTDLEILDLSNVTGLTEI